MRQKLNATHPRTTRAHLDEHIGCRLVDVSAQRATDAGLLQPARAPRERRLNRKLPSGANKLDGSYPERLQLVDLLEAAFGRRAHRLNDEALCAWRKGGRPKTVWRGFSKKQGR